MSLLDYFHSRTISLAVCIVFWSNNILCDDRETFQCANSSFKFSSIACENIRKTITESEPNIRVALDYQAISKQSKLSCSLKNSLETARSRLKIVAPEGVSASRRVHDYAKRFKWSQFKSEELKLGLLTISFYPMKCLIDDTIYVVMLRRNTEIVEGIVGCDTLKINMLVSLDDMCDGNVRILTLEGINSLSSLADNNINIKQSVYNKYLIPFSDNSGGVLARDTYRSRWTDIVQH